MQNSPLKEPNRIEDEESIDSPIKQTSKRKTSGARRRIESSSEEENGSPVKESPPKVKVPTSKGKKRKSSPSSLEKQTKKAKEEETEIKAEEKEVTTPEVNSKKRRSQQEKDALPKKSKSSGCKGKAKTSGAAAAKNETTEAAKAATTEKADDDSKKSPSPKKESPKKPSPVKKEKSSPSPKKAAEKTPKAKVNPFAAMMGKSPASASASTDSKPFEEVIKKTNYDPIKDAIWKKDAKTPYLAFAKALQAVEATSGTDRKIEILSNYFKSVIALSPDDLLPSLYMVSNRIAPAWEGKELGIGETLLMKAIAQTTGRTVKEIKADVGKKGQYYLSTAFFRLICYHRFWSY